MTRRSTRFVRRRTFPQAVAVLFAGLGRCLRAQGRRFRLRYHRLSRPVLVPRDTIAETGPVDDPVYLCPCHNSAFAAADGGLLGGPARPGAASTASESPTSRTRPW